MNNITKYMVAVIATILVVGCSSSPRMIPEEKLKQVITEAMISDAILNSNPSMITDTLDYYAPILKRAGYNLDDFRYTLREMASRKSSPLNNVFDQINKDITAISSKAEYRFRRKQMFDSMALAFFTDTIYRKDTMIKGNVGRYNIVIDSPDMGTYTVLFDYRSHGSYDLGMKNMKVKLDTVDKLKGFENLYWINRMFSPGKFNQTLYIPGKGYPKLSIKFNDPEKPRGFVGPDTSYMSNIRIVYSPQLTTARSRYVYNRTGISLDSIYPTNYEKPRFSFVSQDSLPLVPFTGR